MEHGNILKTKHINSQMKKKSTLKRTGGKFLNEELLFLKKWLDDIRDIESKIDYIDGYHIDEIIKELDSEYWITESIKVLYRYDNWCKIFGDGWQVALSIEILMDIDRSAESVIDVLENPYMYAPPEIHIFDKKNSNMKKFFSECIFIAHIMRFSILYSRDVYDVFTDNGTVRTTI